MTTDRNQPNEKTISDLFNETLLGEYDDEIAWNAIWDLRKIATPEVYKTAVLFCESEDPLKRARGLDVLAQFGVFIKDTPAPYLDERTAIALKHLSDDSEIVINSAAWALSHINNDKAANGLLTVRHSTNPDIRHAVAVGLTGQTSAEAIDALIELMCDPVDDVRDWATFTLGRTDDTEFLLDTPEIRAALRARLTDSNEDVQQEAVWGLALRKDQEGLTILLKNLENETCAYGDKDTAESILNMPHDSPIEDLRDKLRKLIFDNKEKRR